jgi:hypothetical protein
MKLLIGALCASTICAAAMPASADLIVTINWTEHPGSWDQNFGSGSPFGLPADPAITGSVTIDEDLGGLASILALDYTTGSRVWTLADLNPASHATSSGGMVQQVFLVFGPVNPPNDVSFGVDGAADALISDDVNGIDCHCITYALAGAGGGSVPEPAAWALMLAGFGLAGAALRRRAYAAI